jgi:hypothetical protein
VATAVRLDIDLAFSVEFEGAEITGTVTASGSEIDVVVSDAAGLLAGARGGIRSIRRAALELARRGAVVSLAGEDGVLASIGAVRGSVADRLLTGSPHISVRSYPALLAAVRSRRAENAPVFLPPPTLLPLAPTLERNRRPRITTTHYTPGSGRPRLIFVQGSEYWDGRPPREFELRPGVTTIGSAEDSDLRLSGLEPLHAQIRHDEHDEYYLFVLGEATGVPLLDPDLGVGRILRTGARIELGEWRMGYFREEFADHGRPFGGRLGGELSLQRPQPPRH